jgi:hypothetical protein
MSQSQVLQTSHDITYTEQIGNHSSPLYVKLNPINNVQSFNPSLTAVFGPVEILLPSKCLNLSKSKISWDVSVPSQAGANFAWLQGNALCQLDRITLTSQNTNQVLADIPNLNRYASMLTPVLTTQEELQNKASPFTVAAGAATSVVPTMRTTLALAQNTPCEDVSRTNAGANPDGNAIDYGTPYGNSIRKLYVSSAAATANFISFELDLASIQASIFDINKLLYFSGEQLLLSLYFAPVNRYAFLATSASDPTAGVGAAVGTWTVSNLSCYLYTEQNLDVSTALVEKVMRGGGLKVPFPYPFVQRQSVASGSWSITQQLTRGFGSKLLFASFSIFNPTETGATAQDHSLQTIATAAGGTYSALSYNTLIDNIPILTNNNIGILGGGTSAGEQWLYNKAHLKGSAIASLINYNIDFCHIDSFVSDPLCQFDFTTIDGLDLDAMHQYSVVGYGTSGAAVNNNIYIVFVCQKTLNFTASGVQIS